MYEIRIHGRGGQGSVMASKILAKALVEDGQFAKAIPAFGFERRGAPVEAYLRFDSKTIRKVTNIYHPNCIICLDPSLPQSVDIFNGVVDSGVWVHTTQKSIDQLNYPKNISQIGLCDAVNLALELLGRPITNTMMLGVFAKTTGLVSLASLNKAMESVAFRDAMLENNIKAVQRGYDETNTYNVN